MITILVPSTLLATWYSWQQWSYWIFGTYRFILLNNSSSRLYRLIGLVAFMIAPSTRWLTWETGPMPGKSRVRWTCACGKPLYDDFVELKSGATSELHKKLSQFSRKSHTRAGYKRSCNAIVQFISSLFTPSNTGSDQVNDQSERDQLPRFENSNGTSNMNDTASHDIDQPSIREVMDLNLCIAQNHTLTKFRPLDLSSIKSNHALFAQMRSIREKLHNRLYNTFSLRTLRTITFVRFVLHKRHALDIKENLGPLSLPPPNKLSEYKYQHEPAPPDYLPPIGENLLLHLYNHPECADEECADLLPFFPKKVLERLDVCPERGMSEGWGIHFVEDWNWERIWIIAFLFFRLGGVPFAILWWVLEHDVQGASSMATYITGFMALALGVMQLKIQPAT